MITLNVNVPNTPKTKLVRGTKVVRWNKEQDPILFFLRDKRLKSKNIGKTSCKE